MLWYINYDWYHYHHVPQLLHLSGKIQVFVYFFAFFYFSLYHQQ